MAEQDRGSSRQMAPLIFKQRTALGTFSTLFELEEGNFRFTVIERGATSYLVKYIDFPHDGQEIDNPSRPAISRVLAVYFVCATSILVCGVYFLGESASPFFVVALLACGGLLWNYAAIKFRVRVSTFRTPLGPVHVVKDGNHDLILKEISDRRRRCVRQSFIQVNYLNEPYQEIGRFRWLNDRGYIDEAEREASIAAIVAHFNLPPPPSKPPGPHKDLIN